ncbi:PIN domain-containing protein [Thermococcus sp. MV5]|uniref:type II toxin-antitoxin system VapC family toxin n=1 Tax=Thermococcus sp. MV5 TaxID=1638272 RepID=UPI00143B8E5C|nr:PIN domain-containing protein [Thermococcus sp. MV5]NJE26417.1 PIN domain-containing protein [Thermococcus sp. MV5]
MEAPKKLHDTNVIMDAVKPKKKIAGYTTILNLIEFPRGAELELEVLTPSLEDYLLALEISQTMVEQGTPIPAVDAILAAVALKRNFTLVTRDKHFDFIKKEYPWLKILKEE